jgi:Poly(ADP-ribose) polymerase, regulatory domain
LRYSPLDVEEDFEEFEKLPIQLPESKLPVPDQHLIKLLFNEEKLKATMQQDMKIDVKNLLLGKLSDVQITKTTLV